MICEFCQRPTKQWDMCERCAKFYEATRRKDDGTIHAILIWAAKRARYFERLRLRNLQPKGRTPCSLTTSVNQKSRSKKPSC